MSTFKKQRITTGLAARIADAIASRALEQEQADLQVRQVSLSMSAYAEMFGVLSFDAAKTVVRKDIPAWMMEMTRVGESCSLWFKVPESPKSGIEFLVTFNEPVYLPHNAGPIPIKQSTHDKMKRCNDDRRALQFRRHAMTQELKAQLLALGDTHKVVAAWPEVESIIVGTVIEPVPRGVQPLPVLLGRFAPPAAIENGKD